MPLDLTKPSRPTPYVDPAGTVRDTGTGAVVTPKPKAAHAAPAAPAAPAPEAEKPTAKIKVPPPVAPKPTTKPADPAPASKAKPEPAKPAAPSTDTPPTAAAEPESKPTPETETPVEPKEGAPAPAELKLVLPEGSPLTAEHVASLRSVATESGLTADEAQAILERDHALSLQARQLRDLELQQAHARQVQTWEQALRQDPVLGGANLDRTLAENKAFLKKHAPPGLIEILDSTGAGSNVEVLRFIDSMRKIVEPSEDRTKPAGARPVGAPPQRAADKLFGKFTGQGEDPS